MSKMASLRAVIYCMSSIVWMQLLADRWAEAVEAGAPCPCVPAVVRFRFEFQWGCAHPPSASDFASSSYCSISGSPRESSIKKILIKDLANQEEQLVDVVAMPHEELVGMYTYTFDYKRSKQSPTVLWLDFYQTSSASGSPVATIDLNYQGGSLDCIHDANPVFYAGDWIYFLTVVCLCFAFIRKY